MIAALAYLHLILLHGPHGHEIRINPEDISALRPPLAQGHTAPEIRCLVQMTNGKFIGVVESCAKVEKLSHRHVSLVHDQWANGEDVPGWVKSQCCGPKDVHKLQPWQIHEVVGGWKIDGLDSTVPARNVFPSQDGTVWAFWDPFFGKSATVSCLFVNFGN